MPTPLEKARKNPDSMKAKILTCARNLFGEYGFHGATARMIAKEAGIDVSTLYYHWGEKADLYAAVCEDINDGLKAKLIDVERRVKGQPLSRRLSIAIHMMVDYLFDNPAISNLTIFRYFTKTRSSAGPETPMPEIVSNIAYSMGLSQSPETVSPEAKMKVLAIINSIHNFVSGENFFLPMLGVDKATYISLVKETLEFYNIAYDKLASPPVSPSGLNAGKAPLTP